LISADRCVLVVGLTIGRRWLLRWAWSSISVSRLEANMGAAEAHIDAERPDGLIIHGASETADGTVRTVDVWESQQHVDEFERTRLAPAGRWPASG
jgi:hypothetical protein